MPDATESKAATVLLLLGASLCWLACSIAQVEKYLPLGVAIPVCLLGCGAVFATLFILRRAYRRSRDLGLWPLAAVFLLLAASFGILYPKSQRHIAGKGSDREDALRVELYALTHHRYPYDARTYLGHPPTPLPGAMLLALPFYLVKKVALQNLLWAGIFIWFLTRFFRRRSTALAFFFLFLLAALENLNDFDVGGDYMTNIMYVSVAMYIFTRTIRSGRTDWRTILSVLFLGVALSSRIVFLVALPPILALTIQRTSILRGLTLIGAVVTVFAAVTLSVFAPHPVTRLVAQLHQNSDKLQLLPSYLPAWSLVAAAFIVAGLSFATRMNTRKLYLFTGMASLVMILPPMVLFARAEGGLTRPLTTDLEYLAISAVFLSLWIVARWEQYGLMQSERLGTATTRLTRDDA